MKKRPVLIFSVLCAVFFGTVIAHALPQKQTLPEAAKEGYASKREQEAKTGAVVEQKATPTPTFEYTAGRRRDPFMPLIVKADAKPQKRMPIESYKVSEFKLIAILWDDKKYYAVITLPDGKSYTITEGVKLGLEGGSVHKITKDSVIIRGYARDYRGALRPKDTILKLRGEEE